jgi:hypothetical protein
MVMSKLRSQARGRFTRSGAFGSTLFFTRSNRSSKSRHSAGARLD